MIEFKRLSVYYKFFCYRLFHAFSAPPRAIYKLMLLNEPYQIVEHIQWHRTRYSITQYLNNYVKLSDTKDKEPTGSH